MGRKRCVEIIRDEIINNFPDAKIFVCEMFSPKSMRNQIFILVDEKTYRKPAYQLLIIKLYIVDVKSKHMTFSCLNDKRDEGYVIPIEDYLK